MSSSSPKNSERSPKNSERSPVYPDIDSDTFYDEILSKKEFIHNDSEQFCLQTHQKLLSNFINPLTQYSSLLVYHQPGLGKTLTAISIGEKFKKSYKIAVFIKNKILEANFRKELMYSCSNYYTTEEERKILNSNPSEVDYDANLIKEELEKRVAKQINKYYSFYTYGSLSSTNDVSNRPKTLSNSVVICDEIHNGIGNSIYTEIFNLLEKSSNFKTILLTATPIFESVSEIFEISNLLNVGQTRNLLPIRNDLLAQKLVEKIPGENSFLNDTVLVLSKAGREALSRSLRGKVSKLDIPQNSSFAKKIHVGTKISPELSTVVFKTKMTAVQEKIYKTVSKDDVLFKDSSDISTIIYPDNSFGKKGFDKYIKGKASLDFLKKNQLKNYSPKIHSILENLEDIAGPAFIYSNYVSSGGTELIAAVLKSNGYSPNVFDTSSKKKFFVFGEGISVGKRQKILRLFNSKKNINGDIIKVIIGSPAVSEGVSFKNIRSIHILEPHWNLSRIDQIIGRGIRFLSHSNLPEKERNVKIFLHTTLASNPLESIDLLKYILSEKKDRAGKTVSRLLQEISLDCNIFKKKLNSVDYSRECDYDKCDYKCNGKFGKVDTSTYSLKDHSPETMSFILECITKLFSTGFVYTTDFIISYITSKRKNIEVDDILLVLRTAVAKNRKIFKNPNGLPSRIIRNHDTFSITPIDVSSQEQFDRMFTKEVIHKDLPKPYQPQKTKRRSPKKIQFEKGKEIFGIKEDGIFKIVYNPENVKYDDNRKNKSGKVCSSYPKEILKKMIDTLGIKVNDKTKITKEVMCDALEKYLIK
jgi:superfamily II DNA or RNA helicase